MKIDEKFICVPIPLCRQSQFRHAVLLSLPTDTRFINAAVIIPQELQIFPKIAHWIRNGKTGLQGETYAEFDHNQYGGKYVGCARYSWKKNRLYGFLCNPSENNKRLQVFCGVHVAEKHQRNTDTWVLDQIMCLKERPDVKKALSQIVT